MKLKSKPLNLNEFKKRIQSMFEEGYINYDDLPDSVLVTLNKVKHGSSFFACDKHIAFDPYGECMGYNITSNGFTYLGCQVSGKDEYPLFFILYIDPKGKLSAFVPKHGLYDHKEKTTWKVRNEAEIVRLDQIVEIDKIMEEINTQFGG